MLFVLVGVSPIHMLTCQLNAKYEDIHRHTCKYGHGRSIEWRAAFLICQRSCRDSPLEGGFALLRERTPESLLLSALQYSMPGVCVHWKFQLVVQHTPVPPRLYTKSFTPKPSILNNCHHYCRTSPDVFSTPRIVLSSVDNMASRFSPLWISVR